MKCSCDASVDIGCDSVPGFYQKHEHKALKEHMCNECYRTIKENEKYIVEKGKDDDGWFYYKICNDCESVRRIFFNSGYYFECLWENLRDFIFDLCGEIPEDCISKLTPTARNKVCDLIEYTWS